GCGCTARITEIGTASGAANTVTVTAALLDGPSTLLPGMSAEVRVPLGQTEEVAGFLIPLTAIAPGDEAAGGYVFLFDPDDGVVRRTPIKSGDGLAGNLVAIVGDIHAGDIIAAAGVSFLRDGQRVKLLGE
ncbi:MAG: efflux RND transporter periplasmic adaptor subunit, partial [Pseudomonadota bacterium]